MQNLRQSKKGFLVLKKIKIHVFATVTLLFHLKYHNALVYFTRKFRPPKNSGDDESSNSCSELLSQVLIFTSPLSRRKVVTVGVHTTGAVRKSSATRPPSLCPRRPRASRAQGAHPGW